MNKWEDDASNKNLDIDFWINYTDYPILHNHDYWEFFIVAEGSYKHVINGKESIVYKNSGYLIRPNDYHAIYNNDINSYHLNVMVKTHFIKSLCDLYSPKTYDLLTNHEVFPFHLNDNQLKKVFVYTSILRDSNADKDLIAHLLVSYIIEKAISQNDYANNDNRPKWLSDLLLQINSPSNMNWSVQDILARCGYSHSHFARMFKEYMGCSLISYLTKTKMSAAHDLLLHSNMSMLDIALSLGYSSLSRFNHVFKEYYHMSPSTYKKINKN